MAKFLNRLRIPLFATAPSTPAVGETWYDTATDQLRYQTAGTSPPVAAHGGSRFGDYQNGYWYMLQPGAPNTANMTLNRAYTNPFYLPRSAVVSGISVEVSTAWSTTAGNIRIAMYNDDGRFSPTNLVTDYGTQSATVGIKTFTMTTGLTPGWFWLVAISQGASGTAGQFRSVTGIPDLVGNPAATPPSGFFNGSINCYYSDTGFSGSAPASFGTVTGSVIGPRFAIRFSA